MSEEETKMLMKKAAVEIDHEIEIRDKATEIMAEKQRPLIDFGRKVGAVGAFGMVKAFSELMEIQSLKVAQEAFNEAKSRADGALIDGCKSWSTYCAHHGIHTGDAKMRIRLLDEMGEEFIRNASVIGLVRRDYRALMALPSGDQSDLIQTITSIEIESVEQGREVKEQFRSALEIFQEKLTEKDELLRIKSDTNESLGQKVEKLQDEKEKRQEVEDELALVTSERDLYRSGDRPSHNIDEVNKDLEEAKTRFSSALNIARSLKPDNHESLSAIRMLYSWLEDELRFAASVTESHARELDQE